MVTIAIVAAGDPIPVVAQSFGDFAAMIRRAAGNPLNVEWRVIDARPGLPPCPSEDLAGIVVTGSPASVLEGAPWMHQARSYLQSAVILRIPTLGICFGHQLIAVSLGGHVTRNPRGRELGLVEAQGRVSDPVLQLPYGPFLVAMAHEDTVDRLPPRAVVLATTELDGCAAARFTDHCWGVQFHPEFSDEILRAYVSAEPGPRQPTNATPTPTVSGANTALAHQSVQIARRDLLSRFVRFALRRHKTRR